MSACRVPVGIIGCAEYCVTNEAPCVVSDGGQQQAARLLERERRGLYFSHYGAACQLLAAIALSAQIAGQISVVLFIVECCTVLLVTTVESTLLWWTVTSRRVLQFFWSAAEH